MTTSNVDLDACLEAIRVYVSLQRQLIDALELPKEVNEVTFKSLLPKEVIVGKTKWQVAGHGVGVRFTSGKTGEVVDPHEGFIESPEAFDAWRLSTYFDSLGRKPDDRTDWKSLLKALRESGAIQSDGNRSRLYVLSEAAGQQPQPK